MIARHGLTLLFLFALAISASYAAPTAEAGHKCCEPCCDPCPAPCVKQVLCVEDCRRCCLVKVCVDVPACCVAVPEICCRPAMFGRSIAVATWPCGHQVEIVMTRKGEVKVR